MIQRSCLPESVNLSLALKGLTVKHVDALYALWGTVLNESLT
jgi:hypothetical protein